MNGRRTASIIVFLVAVLAMFVPASATAGSVQVRVLRLGTVPAAWQAHRLSVRVSIGSRALYTTPARRGVDAVWNKGLRAYTASTNPLRFQVLAAGAVGDPHGTPAHDAPVPSKRTRTDEPRESADEILSAGLDDLVADYGEGTLDEGADSMPSPREREPRPRPETAQSAEDPGVLCTATLAWPPAPGEHALLCGSAVLFIRIL